SDLFSHVDGQWPKEQQATIYQLQCTLQSLQCVNITLRIDGPRKCNCELTVITADACGWFFKLSCIRCSARINDVRWSAVTTFIKSAHRRRHTQSRLRLAVNISKLFINPITKAWSDVRDAWPIVMNNKMQRHTSLFRDLGRRNPAKSVRHCEYSFKVEAINRL